LKCNFANLLAIGKIGVDSSNNGGAEVVVGRALLSVDGLLVRQVVVLEVGREVVGEELGEDLVEEKQVVGEAWVGVLEEESAMFGCWGRRYTASLLQSARY
jgi:hypothetical protein